METIDRGSPVLVEVETKTRVPFGSLAYYDPTSLAITVTDPGGVKKVDAVSILANRSALGKYYYVVQSLVAWATGTYQVTITGGDGTYNDVIVSRTAFALR